jgi:hypothetical protein
VSAPAPIDTSEQLLPRGLAWDEQAAVPLLADHECSGCGFIPGIEVVSCSCGFGASAAGGLDSTVTTVTVIAGHRVVRCGS